MNLDFVNETQFPGMNFQMIDGAGQCFHVVVIRCTFEITAEGRLEISAEQALPALEDEYFGEPHKSSVRQESDLAPFKPRCDVVVNCTAHSPDGKPAKKIAAGLMMHAPDGRCALSKYIAVDCPRYWEKGIRGDWHLKEAEPLTSLPVRYEYAYGGDLRILAGDPAAGSVPAKLRLSPDQRGEHPDGPENAPIYHSCFPANPLGRGHTDPEFIRALNVREYNAPLIEGLRDPVKNFMQPSPVEGLGIIGRTWRPRIDLAGTYDETWRERRHPCLPGDFNFGYFNCAHPDLQIPYPAGNEEISLYNVLPPDAPGTTKDNTGSTVLTFRLPAQRIILDLTFKRGKTDSAAMDIDTLVIDTDARLVSIVYRKLLPAGEGIISACAKIEAS